MYRFLSVLVLGLFSVTAQATDCGNIPSWLKIREVTFRVVEPTQVYDVKVEFPEISRLKCEAIAFEYGTDYSFTLKRSEPVKLGYSNKGENETRRTAEVSGYLNAHSVLLAAERQKTPHYLEITDEELGVEYHMYLSKNGPGYVKRSGKSQRLNVLSFK
jgi:hypothetical protein